MLGRVLPGQHIEPAVYGVILIGALLAAEDGLHESYLDTVLSAVIAAAIYWLAHAYSALLGRRLTSEHRLTLGSLARALASGISLLSGAAVPVLVLLLAWAGGASQTDGVTAALWSSVAALIVLELLAALRAPATLSERALELMIGVAIGLGIFVLKIVLH
jgi:hypothetical protein